DHRDLHSFPPRRSSDLVDRVIANGSEAYERGRMLPRVLPIGPDELRGAEPETTRRIVLKLARALRAERARGRAGHWTYDLNRHRSEEHTSELQSPCNLV